MKHILYFLSFALISYSCKINEKDNSLIDKKKTEEIALAKEMQRMVKYISEKDTVDAYFSLPFPQASLPALIMIHDSWGLDDWIRNNADRLTARGYAVLAIDLYRGKFTNNLKEANALMSALQFDNVNKDIQAAYSFLQTNPKIDKKRIGVIGWGMGGRFVLQAITSIPDLKAAINCYGNFTSDATNIKKIKTPLLGIFGETDRTIPIIDVQYFEQTLNNAKKENKIIIYRNVAHAFMNPNEEKYNSDIAERAWREIFGFLKKYL